MSGTGCGRRQHGVVRRGGCGVRCRPTSCAVWKQRLRVAKANRDSWPGGWPEGLGQREPELGREEPELGRMGRSGLACAGSRPGDAGTGRGETGAKVLVAWGPCQEAGGFASAIGFTFGNQSSRAWLAVRASGGLAASRPGIVEKKVGKGRLPASPTRQKRV